MPDGPPDGSAAVRRCRGASPVELTLQISGNKENTSGQRQADHRKQEKYKESGGEADRRERTMQESEAGKIQAKYKGPPARPARTGIGSVTARATQLDTS